MPIPKVGCHAIAREQINKQIIRLIKAMTTRETSAPPLSGELYLTRNLLLERMQGARWIHAPMLQYTRNFSCVTHWEELLCVAINTKLERLMAVVCIRQPEGYSSLLNNHNSREFIRFFIDWGRGDDYEPAALADFEVSDVPLDRGQYSLPHHELVTGRLDADRYWDSVLDGIQPKVRAVLSWNLMPPEDVEFQPAFGNVVESRIRTESIRDITALYEHHVM
jgi:hypothetical protein